MRRYELQTIMMLSVQYHLLFIIGTSLLIQTSHAVIDGDINGIALAGGGSVLVSLSGADIPSCGTITSCRSVQYALGEGIVKEGDTVLLTGETAHSSEHQYLECVDWTFNATISFTLAGAEATSHVGCHGDRALRSYITFLATRPNVSVTFRDLDFNQVSIRAIDVSATFQNCVFRDSTLAVDAMGSIPVFPVLSGTRWLGLADCSDDYKCAPTGDVTFKGFMATILIEDSVFLHTKLSIYIRYDCIINIRRNLVSNSPGERAVTAGIFISLSLTAQNSTINVHDTVLENQYHWNPVDSVSNIFMSSLLVRLLPPQDYVPVPNNVRIHIHNSSLENNERALTFQGVLENILITDCTFKNNIAMHAGAAILVLLFTKTPIQVTNCTFESNAAGFYRTSNVRPPGDYFSVQGDEAMVDSKCCKGSVSMIGKGGALRLQKGNMILENTTFRNNTARILGGTIFVDRASELKVYHCTFYNVDRVQAAAQQGDIIFSDGKVTINGGHLLVQSASNHISLLRHSGEHWSISVYDIDIECPIGHRLRVMNTSAFRIQPHVGLAKSYMLDQLSYFCESCPRNRYSTDRGTLKYQLNEGVYQYFSLMINGESPKSDFDGTYQYNDITCLDCPYGGICDSYIRSLPNFWGYEVKGKITFQQCPKGYCCSATSCPTFNGCAKFRKGILCSQCIEGYSEALFSSKCLPSEECGPFWIWPFSAGMGILYMLFLFFQKDVRDFIFTRPSECDDMTCCLSPAPAEPEYSMCEKLEKDAYTNNKFDDEANEPLQNGDVQDTELKQCSSKTDLNKPDLTPQHEENSPDKTKSNGVVSIDANDNPNKSLVSNEETGNPVIANEDNEADKASITSDTNEPAQPPPALANRDMGAIYLIIIMYYFQDAQLFNIKTASAVPDNTFHANLRTVLLGLFKFRLEVAHFVDNVCLVQGLSASEKLLAKTLLVPYTLFLFGLLYIFYMCFASLRAKTEENEQRKEVFLSRLCTGFMLALMFTYQRLATTTFKLLNCVPVGNDSVLFIDGSVKCYEMWQYGVIAYAICCIVPFCGVLLLAPSLLKEGRISLPTFFTACIIPFPFVIFWAIKRVTSTECCMKATIPDSPHRDVVIKILQGPFRDLQGRLVGPFCWAGILIARRLILVLLFTFINHSLIRIIAMLLSCFVILLHHVHVQPYKDMPVNIAGSVSVSALMIVGGINLVRAGFEVAEYVPIGPNERLMWFMKSTENVMMLWFPATIMGMVFLGMIVKIFFIIMFACKQRRRDNES